jgi:hypothetical protein
MLLTNEHNFDRKWFHIGVIQAQGNSMGSFGIPLDRETLVFLFKSISIAY